MEQQYTRIKWACYIADITMSAVVIMPALLFARFQSQYGISYSLLGLLVLVNFTTQLGMDLVFTFFSHRFDLGLTVKRIPLIATVGFLIYALLPQIAPQMAYAGLLCGTVVFSAACGLSEVLISPVIAAIPSENHEKEMSKLHAMYAWGVVGVTIFASLVLHYTPPHAWYVLVLCLLVLPLVSAVLFSGVTLPTLETPQASAHVLPLLRNKQMLFCVGVIFFGGASEGIISQWSSSYLEQALSLSKLWGDMLGVAFFAVMLGFGRTLYAHKGKNIHKTMLIGSMGAAICYATLIFVDVAWVGILACAFTGLCVAMLWPGSLIMVQDKIPHADVAVFALMAAGGDLGCAIAPQLVGVVTDMALNNEALVQWGAAAGYVPAQIAMKCGMLLALVFPVVATALLLSPTAKRT